MCVCRIDNYSRFWVGMLPMRYIEGKLQQTKPTNMLVPTAIDSSKADYQSSFSHRDREQFAFFGMSAAYVLELKARFKWTISTNIIVHCIPCSVKACSRQARLQIACCLCSLLHSILSVSALPLSFSLLFFIIFFPSSHFCTFVLGVWRRHPSCATLNS